MNEESRLEHHVKITDYFMNEADRCYRGGAYFAGGVMLGATLEASLIELVYCQLPMVDKRKATPGKSDDSIADPVNWTFEKLLDAAIEAGWLPDEAHSIRKIRNLVHPGKFFREGVQPFTKEDFHSLMRVTQQLAEQIYGPHNDLTVTEP